MKCVSMNCPHVREFASPRNILSMNWQAHELMLRIIDPQIDMSVKRVPMKRPVTIMGIYLSDSLTAV